MPPLPANASAWVYIVIAVLMSGSLKYVVDAVKERRIARAVPRPVREAVRHQAAVDASIVTVVRARDELEADLASVREVLREERAQWAVERERHERERLRWQADQDRLRADIARLEEQIGRERREAAARYDALLEQVHALQRQIRERGREDG